MTLSIRTHPNKIRDPPRRKIPVKSTIREPYFGICKKINGFKVKYQYTVDHIQKRLSEKLTNKVIPDSTCIVQLSNCPIRGYIACDNNSF